MASTRNKNMRTEYSLEQNNNTGIRDFNINQYGRGVNEANPTHMMNHGSMARDALSGNAVDTESQLFGIGSTNLVQPQMPIRPDVKTLGNVDFCERKELINHDSIYIMNNQRPMRR